MNLQKNICRIDFVPDYEKKDIGVATRVSESVKRELERIADEHDRKPGYVIRELMLRGLYHYHQDGRLKITSAEHHAISTATATYKEDAARLQNLEDADAKIVKRRPEGELSHEKPAKKKRSA